MPHGPAADAALRSKRFAHAFRHVHQRTSGSEQRRAVPAAIQQSLDNVDGFAQALPVVCHLILVHVERRAELFRTRIQMDEQCRPAESALHVFDTADLVEPHASPSAEERHERHQGTEVERLLGDGDTLQIHSVEGPVAVSPHKALAGWQKQSVEWCNSNGIIHAQAVSLSRHSVRESIEYTPLPGRFNRRDSLISPCPISTPTTRSSRRRTSAGRRMTLRSCTLLVRLIAFVTSTNDNSSLGLLALAEPLRANLIQICEGHISKLDKPKKIDEISRKIPAID